MLGIEGNVNELRSAADPLYVCMYACMHVFMYACMHACMYACMHVLYACKGVVGSGKLKMLCFWLVAGRCMSSFYTLFLGVRGTCNAGKTRQEFTCLFP